MTGRPEVTTLLVRGMTCGHCVDAVTREVASVPGVLEVTIDLVTGGDSHVQVTSATPLPAGALAAAVDEAGYELVGRS